METSDWGITDWYRRDHLDPDERTARELLDKMGNRGYLAAGADLSFMSRLIQHALVKTREEALRRLD